MCVLLTCNGLHAAPAGHVDPPQMLNPGLIFDSTYEDWAKALCANDIDVQLPAGMKNRYTTYDMHVHV